MSEHTIPYKAGWSWALTKIFNGHDGKEVTPTMLETVANTHIDSDEWDRREFAKGTLAACKHFREIT